MNAYANVCIYYTPANLTARPDPYADALLLDVIRPTTQALRQRRLVEGWTFMRFAERGCHLRLTLFGDSALLRDQAIPFVKAQVGAYLADHRELIRPSARLAPISPTPSRAAGRPSGDMAAPGTIEATIVSGPGFGPDEDHENEAVMLANTALQTALCEELIGLLALAPTMKVRKQFVRQLLDDMLRMALPSARERYVFLHRIKSGWIDFFELQPAVISFYQSLYQKNAARLAGFFDRKIGIGDSMAVLPPESHAAYRGFIALFERALPQIVLRAGEGRSFTARDANRLGGVYHLLHNRLSLGIEEEVYLSFMLAQHSLSSLEDRDISEISHALGLQHEHSHLRHLL